MHPALSRADLALILLAEIAYENDEDFRGHLPLLFHVAFVSMDSPSDLVLEHCQQLLVNLLYSLAGRHLDLFHRTAGEHKHKVGGAAGKEGHQAYSMYWCTGRTLMSSECGLHLLGSLQVCTCAEQVNAYTCFASVSFVASVVSWWRSCQPSPSVLVVAWAAAAPVCVQVVTLIKYVQSRQGSRMWDYEDMTVLTSALPSAALLASLVHSVVEAIFFQVRARAATPPQAGWRETSPRCLTAFLLFHPS